MQKFSQSAYQSYSNLMTFQTLLEFETFEEREIAYLFFIFIKSTFLWHLSSILMVLMFSFWMVMDIPIIKLTPSITVAQIRKAPHIAETDGVTNATK